MFNRKIEKLLENYYKDTSYPRILVISGARQVGKSFIISETAKKHYSNFIAIDLKDDYEGEKRFENIKTTSDLYLLLSSFSSSKLNNYEDTLIFLDEIQYYPHLMTMLKPLNLERKYRFIVSGSLLGITLRHSFIPMGSIEEVRMFPMDFEEFLWANDYGKDTIQYLKDSFLNLRPINESIHQYTLKLFREYLISGGLPAAINEFVVNKNVMQTRKVQTDIHSFYSDDCSKYEKDKKLKIKRIYDLLPPNMANKVKRIRFKAIEGKQNSNFEKYEDEFDYLFDSGIAHPARAVPNPVFPLMESMCKDLIKVYFNDVGILTNILYRNNIDAILNKDKNINLGSVYETAVAMELIAHGHELYYFDNKKIGEVDFLVNDYDNLSILPIEVKSGNDQTNFRAIPKLVDEKGNYKLKYGYVLGNKNIVEKKNNLVTIPVYLCMFL